ncbi:hypothetical protein [Streptomyces subrutilus]|uniref:Uncharacterized protein n=1 Tax=Streptomyces subrutilus TaxID=36818 RepID=A0A5P2UKC1_9ACTN|nr:hypothetical protein [Streptomyces subrutilus]QEU78081.1 hypothetical protein CP968_07110 [Streptomyces subrutilus]WSJ32752.1 hypothetical protein OG479_27595 [Streptomyces subrutilus]GGZ56244.1 hypothetical protein GCM10010371_14700 [Streptomyces subrutilus]
MSDLNAPKRLGFGLLGAVLAGGLLVAACAAPEGPSRAQDPGGTAPPCPAAELPCAREPGPPRRPAGREAAGHGKIPTGARAPRAA